MGMKGKKHSKKTKEKMSLTRQGRRITEGTKEKIRQSKLGKPLSEAHKIKISKTRKRLYKEGKIVPWNRGITHTEQTKQKLRELRLKQVIPVRNTIPEVMLQNSLREVGIPFETHKVIENFVQCDIFIEPNIVIFVDGCYWHGCPREYPVERRLTTEQNRNKIRDIIVNEKLKNKYYMMRFWEHEIKERLEEIVNVIMEQRRWLLAYST
jgi:DNA mismatch endonuclease (patch repair protein)